MLGNCDGTRTPQAAEIEADLVPRWDEQPTRPSIHRRATLRLPLRHILRQSLGHRHIQHRLLIPRQQFLPDPVGPRRAGTAPGTLAQPETNTSQTAGRSFRMRHDPAAGHVPSGFLQEAALRSDPFFRLLFAKYSGARGSALVANRRHPARRIKN